MTDQTARPPEQQYADDKQTASNRGRNAELVLNNQAFVDGWSGMRQQIIDDLAACSLKDIERLQMLTWQLQSLDRLRFNLESYVIGGKAADADIMEIRKRHDQEMARAAESSDSLFKKWRSRSAFGARPSY